MRALLAVVLSALCVPARADEPGGGARIWAGPAIALDPAFGAITAGADYFLSRRAGLGIGLAQTLSGLGDVRAAETGYGFVTALGRLRAAPAGRLRLEGLAGVGLARTRFGAPGERTSLSAAVAAGAALGVLLPARLELALEATTHVVFGPEEGSRNPPHTSEVAALVLRWGGPRP